MYLQNGIILHHSCTDSKCIVGSSELSFKLNTAQFKSLPLIIGPLSGDRKYRFYCVGVEMRWERGVTENTPVVSELGCSSARSLASSELFRNQ